MLRTPSRPLRVLLLTCAVGVLLVLPHAGVIQWQRVVARQAASFNGPPASTSGADPAYPLNHTLDGNVVQFGAPTNDDFEAAPQSVGTAPSNSDFSSAPAGVGAQPANDDLQAAAGSVGTPPTNNTFSTGDFTGWTTSGGASIQSDTPHGYYADLPNSGGSVISSAFTVDASAQSLTFDFGELATQYGYSWLKVYFLSGSGYGTQTAMGDF